MNAEKRAGSLRWLPPLLLTLLVAAALRFYGLNWDGGLGAHPDERYVVSVAERLRWPDRLNPFDIAPDFAYGHLPLYLLASVSHLFPTVDPLLLGRALAALFDLGTVGLTFALGRQIYGDKVGMLAAALVAVTVSHVQQAHFYTADVLLTFFVTGTLLFAARLAGRGRTMDAGLAGAWAGLALGMKLSAALLALPLGAACTILTGERATRRKCALVCGGATLLAFALVNPFALLECSAFWRNAAEQAAIARGALDVPYTRQFHAAWPYLYPVVQQLRWGMGGLLGLAAFGGLGYAAWRAVQEPPRPAEWVLLAWALPGCAFVGALYAKFPRYLLPLTPPLILYAARLVANLPGRRLPPASCFLLPASCLLLPASCLLLLASCLLPSLALVGLYRAPHPWQAASAWLYEHAPHGAVIAVEEWDHPLPLDATGYEIRMLPIFDDDTPEKWAAIGEALAEADYVVIASQRGYGALARWRERYPLTADYYRRLFEGQMGFEAVACFGRYPRLGPIVLTDNPTAGLDFSLPALCRPDASLTLSLGRLDESFVVYDHPQTIIFRRAPIPSVRRD